MRGDGQLSQFSAGAFPCLLVAGAVAVYLARRMRAQGRSFWLGAGIVAFSILNPANLHAIGDGHPEEILGAALCVAALISASEDRSLLVTGTLLGLAVGTKQWALLAIGPVLLAAPRGRFRIGLLGVGIAVLLTVPLALGNPGGFTTKTRAAADASVALMPDNIWYPVAHVRHVRIFDGVAPRVIEKRYLPRSISTHAKPFVVLLGLLLPLAVYVRRRHRPGAPRGGAAAPGAAVRAALRARPDLRGLLPRAPDLRPDRLRGALQARAAAALHGRRPGALVPHREGGLGDPAADRDDDLPRPG